MSNKYLEAYSFIDNGKICYKSFKMHKDDKVIRYSPSGDAKIVKAMEEYNIRPTGSLKYHQALIKNDMFVNYVDNYLIPQNKKKKKRNKQFKLSKKWWAFIATASVLAIVALNSRAEDVSATENETAITTEEQTTEEITPVMNEAAPTIEREIDITSSKDNQNENGIINNDVIDSPMIYNDFEDIFQYSSENLSNDYYDYIISNYGQYLDKYCPMYGMDKNLAIAIISQENPLNSPNIYSYINEDLGLRDGAYGPAQEENVHHGEIICCKNQITNETDYINDYVYTDNNGNPVYGVDVKRCETDMDYAMKVFVMTFMFNTNYLNNKESFELSDSQFIHIVTDAYNKGVYGVEGSISRSNSYEEVIAQDKNLGGDIDYGYNVFKHLKDGTEITLITNDGVHHTAVFDNTNINEYITDSSKETKAMAR